MLIERIEKVLHRGSRIKRRNERSRVEIASLAVAVEFVCSRPVEIRVDQPDRCNTLTSPTQVLNAGKLGAHNRPHPSLGYDAT